MPGDATRQVFNVVLSSERSLKEVDFLQMGRPNKLFKDFPLAGWYIGIGEEMFPTRKELWSWRIPHREEKEKNNGGGAGKQKTSASGQQYPVYEFRFLAERQATWFLWNVFFITFLMVLISLLSFLLPLEVTSARMDITLSMMLAAVAYKIVISNQLPKLS